MKKFLLLSLSALLCCVYSFAQVSKPTPIQPRSLDEINRTGVPFLNDTHKMRGIHSPIAFARNNVKLNGKKGVSSKVTVVSDTPAGTAKTFTRSGESFYSFWGYLFNAVQDGTIINTVYAEDGKTVWFQDIVSQCAMGTWVSGTISDDGKTVTVPLGQCLYYYDSYGYGYELGWVKYVDGVSMDTDQSKTEAKFTVGDDGTLTLQDSYSDSGTGEYVGLAAVWSDDKSWSGNMDYSTVYTPFEMPDMVTPPADAEVKLYSMTYGEDDARTGRLVNVVIDGNDVYVQNLNDNLPDPWIKGTISGSTVTFPTNQFMGMYGNYLIYLVNADTQTGELLGDLVFNYDATTQSFNFDGAMFLNVGTASVYYLQYYVKPVFQPFVEVATTPADPSVTAFEEKNRIDGYNYGTFSIPLMDVDGNFIDPAKLYYKIYIDDDQQVFTFSPDEYPYVTEEMTEVPYNYTDGYDINTGATQIYFYETGFHKIGIQSIYFGQGERRESNIGWYTIQDDGSSSAAETKQYFGNYKGDEATMGNVGTKKAETYDVAMYVKDAALEGVQITGLRIPVSTTATSIKSYKGWLSRELSLQTVDGVSQAAPDIVSAEATPDGDWVDITFDKPYTMGLDGIYAGYTFTVDDATGEGDQYPVMLTTEYNENGYWLHTSRTYRSWTNRSDVYSASSAVVLKLTGDAVKLNAAAFQQKDVIYAIADSTINVDLTVVNHGSATVKSIDYSYEFNGQKRNRRVSLGAGIDGQYFGQTKTITVSLPAVSETGTYPVTFTINKVSSSENQDATPSMSTNVQVNTFLPEHRSFMEEYTGTWCGWCTRGLVALETMNELYPNDFVAVAYHNSDPMEIMTADQFPSSVAGFPDAYLDRAVEVDPFYGTGSESLGIQTDWLARCSTIAPADIWVEGVWTDANKTAVNVTATTRFLDNYNEDRYRIEYILVADGLTGGSDSQWNQSNYYANYASYYGDDPYLGTICNQPSTITGYKFNDVAVKISGNSGVAGSVPTEITAGTYYQNTYKFDLASVVNTSGTSLVQDKANLRVVAILIDTTTGEVVNCNKGTIGTEPTGISLTEQQDAVQTSWYDLQGRRLQSQPKHGLAIKSMRMADGTTINQKVVRK